MLFVDLANSINAYLSMYGRRAFFISVHTDWNSLPDNIWYLECSSDSHWKCSCFPSISVSSA